MPRARTIILVLVGVALVAGLTWLALDIKLDLRLAPYDEPASGPPPGQESLDRVLAGVAWGLKALAAVAVAFTAWAVARQVLRIRRGGPDSR